MTKFEISLPCRTPECPNTAAIFRGGFAYMCEPCASREAKRRATVRRPTLATECANGHPWEPGTWKTDSKGSRVCLTCQRAATKRYRDKRKAEGYVYRLVKL